MEPKLVSQHQTDNDVGNNDAAESTLVIDREDSQHTAQIDIEGTENSAIAEVDVGDTSSRRLRKRKISSKNNFLPKKKKKEISVRRNKKKSSIKNVKKRSKAKLPFLIVNEDPILDPTKYTLHHYEDGKLCIFVYASDDNSSCYEFRRAASGSKNFRCLGCRRKSQTVSVRLLQNETSGEYTVCMKENLQHHCIPREYNPLKFKRTLVYSSNFQFFYGEKCSLKAIIFDDQKISCHVYSYREGQKLFFCNECAKKRKTVAHSLHKDDNDQEYFNLENKRHRCVPLSYAEVTANVYLFPNSGLPPKISKIKPKQISNAQNKNKSSTSKNVKTQQRQNKNKLSSKKVKNGDGAKPSVENEDPILDRKKYTIQYYNDQNFCIFVFASNDRSSCYEFRKASPKSTTYRCLGCRRKGQTVTIKLLQTSGKYVVYMKDNLQHHCIPRAYNPHKFTKTLIYSSNFQFFYENASLKAVIFNDDKVFCHVYTYRENQKLFFCNGCTKKKKTVAHKLHKNEKDEEYFDLGNGRHCCEPLNYSVVTANVQLLPNSGLP